MRPRIRISEWEEDRLWELYDRPEIIRIARGRSQSQAQTDLEAKIRELCPEIKPDGGYLIARYLVAIFANTE